MLRGIPPSVNVNFPPSFARVPSNSPLTPHFTWEMSRGQANSPLAASFPSNAAQSFPGAMALPSISHLTGGQQKPDNRWPFGPTAQQFNGMPYTAMTSPGATSCGGQGNSIAPPVCQNCSTSTTPLWRRDEIGSVLCNACGLFLKLHGRPRPISLKTDVIKSRNRIKNTTPQNKKRIMMQQMGQGMPADMNVPSHSNNQSSGQDALAYGDRMSPVSRTHTPGGMNGHNQQAYYDPNLGRSPSPTMQQFPGHYQAMGNSGPYHSQMGRPGSPNQGMHANHLAHAGNGHGAGSLPATHASSAPPSYNELQTRVSELEVINELYRSRVAELEAQQIRDKETISKMKLQLGGSGSVHGDDTNIINEEMIANGNGSPHSQGTKRKSDAIEDPASQEWSKRIHESYPEPPQPQMLGA